VLAHAVRRLAAALVTVAVVVTLTFVLAHLAPGEPMLADVERMRVDHETVARLRREFGLDRSLTARYARYVANVARGNLGESFTMRRPVATVLRERIPNTLLLGAAALLLSFALGVAVAVAQAARRGSWMDGTLGAGTLVAFSMPSFWLGLVLLWLFGQVLGWLPTGGMTEPVLHQRMGPMGRMFDVLRHLVLPALTLALVQAAAIARFQRGALVDALSAEFVRAARSRGLGEARVLLRHALRASLAPVIVLAGTSVPFLLAGSVLVETVFGWPGMGRMTSDAIFARDYNLITAAGLVTGVLVALGNLAADLAVAAVDPRHRG
jgi:peptide/nickel transport system permease protein